MAAAAAAASGLPRRRRRGSAVRDAAAEVPLRRLQESSARLDQRRVSAVVLQESERPGEGQGLETEERGGWPAVETARRQGKREKKEKGRVGLGIDPRGR